MVARAALAIVAVVSLLGSAVAVAETGAFNTSGAGTVNLGILAPGSNGTASATTSVTISNSSEYKIQRTMEDRIGSVFSSFMLNVTVNGHSFNLSHDQGDSQIYLKNGTYSISMKLTYQVRNQVHSANKSTVPFLFLQEVPNGSMENEPGDHNGSFDNQTGAGNTTDSSVSVITPFDQGSANDTNDSGSSRIVAFTLTFQVNGNAGNDNQNNSERETHSNGEDTLISL